jgi:hypothetical protein
MGIAGADPDPPFNNGGFFYHCSVYLLLRWLSGRGRERDLSVELSPRHLGSSRAFFHHATLLQDRRRNILPKLPRTVEFSPLGFAKPF